RARQTDLLLAARMLAADYALRQLFLQADFNQETARSALASYQDRIQASGLIMLDPAGALLAATQSSETRALESFRRLREVAEQGLTSEAAGWGFMGDKALNQIVLVPLFAPHPEIAAWIGVGFSIDHTTAENLKDTSSLEVTFLTLGETPRVLASTLAVERAEELARLARPEADATLARLSLGGEEYVSRFRRVDTATGQAAWVVLQRSLAVELAPARALENVLVVFTLASLAAALLVGLFLARSISRPVRRLEAHTRVIAGGDYVTAIHLPRADELGRLAEAFNALSSGLAERDRVRDLLDKNVSPEVAARLLRDGAALGGEEREVTVLFADLRGFTPLSEGLPARELITLLNRYLDRMSAAVEAQGGVVDKYIGDEIMAIFGAPVDCADSADRAVRAALAMRGALAELNRELAAEGRPPLAFGVGINTAQVIAGNIGSRRRLNYSVIGDGVNLAARLQPLTRRAEFGTDIIISDFTRAALGGSYALRALGDITVKGKSTASHIHAVDAAL
ncbi:MAG: Adenylate cyclase 1, partial [Verrucomicrobiota bacterium]